MSIGTSGRVVIEIEPELKLEIYKILKSNGMTLKEWFLLQSKELLNDNKKNKDNEVNS
ncbi:hypothetical protein [uncultured Pseudoalteromonas sp.]|jgi:hypothetical protein|uniref:hypothetical protein n=1 Tax=uncultured Pseudoalteromonas sp. TaxID=114053 RepID=UPI0032B23D00